MDSKIKKWIMVMLAVLVISAAAAGFMPERKKTSAIGKGKDYVAEIRIDGTIYGGPRNGTLLGASEGVSSEQVMYEMEQARKDNRVKGVLLRINSPGVLREQRRKLRKKWTRLRMRESRSSFPWGICVPLQDTGSPAKAIMFLPILLP